MFTEFGKSDTLTRMNTDGANEGPQWPGWFPANCPPPEAAIAKGEFFRLVDGDTVVEEDFLSHYELHAAGRIRRYWSDDDEWKAAACSVHADRTDADNLRLAIGSLLHKRVARGSVSTSGAILSTPSNRASSHHSWWRPVGDVAWTTFEVTP